MLCFSFDLLADCPEKLVRVSGSGAPLPPPYNATAEFRFNTPLNFFETITSQYLANQLSHLPKIHIMSLGSGQLLREQDLYIKNIYNRTPLDYYKYQVNVSELKAIFSYLEKYQLLLEEYNDPGSEIFEFSQLYREEDEILAALDFRNAKPINLSLFGSKTISDSQLAQHQSTPLLKSPYPR